MRSQPQPIRFRSAASGAWYENPNAAGDVDAINDNGCIIVRKEEDTDLQWLIRCAEWHVKRSEAKAPRPPSPPRICVICGARVTNINPVVVTCSHACQLAKDHNISRERALRLLPVNTPVTNSVFLDKFIRPK